MTQQTLIENRLNTAWRCRWIGKHGIYLEPKESVVEEGAYPTACVNDAARQQMQFDLDAKKVRVSIITDLPVIKPVTKRGTKASPAAAQKAAEEQAAAEAEDAAKAETPDNAPARDNLPDNQVFTQGSVEEGLPPAQPLDGETTPPNPETQTIFPGDSPMGTTAGETEPPTEPVAPADPPTAPKKKRKKRSSKKK